jgi:chromate transporter
MAAASLALLRYKVGVIPVIAVSALAGLLLRLAGLA